MIYVWQISWGRLPVYFFITEGFAFSRQGHPMDGLMQKRRNSIANTLELRLFCIKPSLRGTDLQYMYMSWDGGISTV